MYSKARGKLVIFFSYVSVLAIGTMIYLVVFLFAENHQSAMRNSAEPHFIFPQNLVRNPQNSQNLTQDFSQTPPDSAKSLDELPNEIDSAVISIEKPTQDSAPKIAESAKKFPRDFIVEAKILNVRATPSTNGKILKRFKKGALISIRKIEGEWAQLEKGGFAFVALLKDSADEGNSAKVKDSAKIRDSAKVRPSADSAPKSPKGRH